MSDDRIAKQGYVWIPEERRKRGRPRGTWQHVISKEEKALSLAGDKESGGIGLSNVLGLRSKVRPRT